MTDTEDSYTRAMTENKRRSDAMTASMLSSSLGKPHAPDEPEREAAPTKAPNAAK